MTLKVNRSIKSKNNCQITDFKISRKFVLNPISGTRDMSKNISPKIEKVRSALQLQQNDGFKSDGKI
jgi:hypothetical protein